MNVWSVAESTVRFCIRCFEKISNKQVSEKSVDTLVQLVKFDLVGITNSVVNYVVYFVSLKIFRGISFFPGKEYLAAQGVAFFLSVLWAFYFNRKYVFERRDNSIFDIFKSLLITYTSYAFTGLFLSELLLVFWIKTVGLSEFVAPIINILICLPLNFILNKLWAFRSPAK